MNLLVHKRGRSGLGILKSEIPLRIKFVSCEKHIKYLVTLASGFRSPMWINRMSSSETIKDKMEILLNRMKQIKAKMDELNYAAYVLERQGKISEAVSKHRGAEFAKGLWRELDADYKRLWKRQHVKRSD